MRLRPAPFFAQWLHLIIHTGRAHSVAGSTVLLQKRDIEQRPMFLFLALFAWQRPSFIRGYFEMQGRVVAIHARCETEVSSSSQFIELVQFVEGHRSRLPASLARDEVFRFGSQWCRHRKT